MKLIPLADNVLIKSALEEETTASGIILATATRKSPSFPKSWLWAPAPKKTP